VKSEGWSETGERAVRRGGGEGGCSNGGGGGGEFKNSCGAMMEMAGVHERGKRGEKG